MGSLRALGLVSAALGGVDVIRLGTVGVSSRSGRVVQTLYLDASEPTPLILGNISFSSSSGQAKNDGESILLFAPLGTNLSDGSCRQPRRTLHEHEDATKFKWVWNNPKAHVETAVFNLSVETIGSFNVKVKRSGVYSLTFINCQRHSSGIVNAVISGAGLNAHQRSWHVLYAQFAALYLLASCLWYCRLLGHRRCAPVASEMSVACASAVLMACTGVAYYAAERIDHKPPFMNEVFVSMQSLAVASLMGAMISASKSACPEAVGDVTQWVIVGLVTVPLSNVLIPDLTKYGYRCPDIACRGIDQHVSSQWLPLALASVLFIIAVAWCLRKSLKTCSDQHVWLFRRLAAVICLYAILGAYCLFEKSADLPGGGSDRWSSHRNASVVYFQVSHFIGLVGTMLVCWPIPVDFDESQRGIGKGTTVYSKVSVFDDSPPASDVDIYGISANGAEVLEEVSDREGYGAEE